MSSNAPKRRGRHLPQKTLRISHRWHTVTSSSTAHMTSRLLTPVTYRSNYACNTLAIVSVRILCVPHTGGEMRGFYPVFRWWKLPAAWRYTTPRCDGQAAPGGGGCPV